MGKEIKNILESSLGKVIKFRLSLNLKATVVVLFMAAEYIDQHLVMLLKTNLIDNKSVIKGLLDNPNGPLSTFSSHIELAYALGLIYENAHSDLHLIRKIRNEFAHTSEPISFNNNSISDKCLRLGHRLFPKSNNPRANYTQSVLGILAALLIEIKFSKKPREKKSSYPTFKYNPKRNEIYYEFIIKRI